MGISTFERRLEQGIEGLFGRLFRSELKPVELGRKLVREMDAHRTVGVDGNDLVPNTFEFGLAPEDHRQMSDVVNKLQRELADAAREHARDEHYRFAGPVEVVLVIDESRRAGSVTLTSWMRESEDGAAVGALVLPDGQRVPLGEFTVTMGRAPENHIVLADPNVSRHHAEVRPAGDGFALADLGSTNGSRLNGARVAEQRLNDGDQVMLGNTLIRFEAS